MALDSTDIRNLPAFFAGEKNAVQASKASGFRGDVSWLTRISGRFWLSMRFPALPAA
jgi:hypothetical protein